MPRLAVEGAADDAGPFGARAVVLGTQLSAHAVEQSRRSGRILATGQLGAELGLATFPLDSTRLRLRHFFLFSETSACCQTGGGGTI